MEIGESRHLKPRFADKGTGLAGKIEVEEGQCMDWEATGLSCACCSETKDILSLEASRGPKGGRLTTIAPACQNGSRRGLLVGDGAVEGGV